MTHSTPIPTEEFEIVQLTLPSVIRPPNAVPFTLTLTVGSHALGSIIAHVSNVEYVRWIDRIEELHGVSIGLSRATLLARQRMWFVLRHEIDYLCEVFEADSLGCATWISRRGRTTIQRETVIWHRGREAEVCRASSRWAYIDLNTRKPVQAPEIELQLLQPLAP